jgi:hypothetical protein
MFVDVSLYSFLCSIRGRTSAPIIVNYESKGQQPRRYYEQKRISSEKRIVIVSVQG